jgi:hypothetical protein
MTGKPLNDQVILYHWTKYAKRSASIVFGHNVESWVPSVAKNSTTVVGHKGALDNPLKPHTCLAEGETK